MSGYPSIPTRASFGPTYRDERPVVDSETELGADVMNLAFWQLAGAGRTLPRAVLSISGGATPVVGFQALAFDPNGVLNKLAITRTGAGDYSFTFDATYTNERGEAVAFAPTAAVAIVLGTDPSVWAIAQVDGQEVGLTIQDSSAVAVDASLLVLVW